jgi:hypothetical protein
VKGLKQAEFADAEDGVVEFGDWGMETNASLWRRMREWMLAKFGQETADQVVPDWQIESIREAARQDDDAPRTAFADPIVSQTHPPHEENHAVTPEEKAALEAENAQLKQRLAEADAREKASTAAKRHGDHLAYAEQLVGEGKLAPKHKEAVVAFLDFADGETALEFGEGMPSSRWPPPSSPSWANCPRWSSSAKPPPRTRPGSKPPATRLRRERRSDRLALDGKIRQYMQEHKVDYATAASCVIK